MSSPLQVRASAPRLASRARTPPTSWARSLVVASIACALFVLGGAARAARREGVSSEYQVKAAFLLNFAKYVKWPERVFTDPAAPIVVAVVGVDPFGKVLDDTLRDKVVGSRKLAVRRFKSVADIGDCHILFVAPSETARLARVLELCQGKSMLLVGETDKFAALGGVLGFFLEDNKVRFEINADAVKRAELEISSQLMKLARIVKDGAGGLR